MPEISRFYGMIVAMYFNEHNPPHFHVKYGEFKAEIDIQTLKIINGNIPKRAKALILEWADEHRQELLEDWNLARQQNDLKPIEPLN
jgi:hypothetical protein